MSTHQVDFQKGPSSDFIWRGTKDFSYLIGVNFTDPKSGRVGALVPIRVAPKDPWGQSRHPQVLSALKRDLRLQFQHGVDCEVALDSVICDLIVLL